MKEVNVGLKWWVFDQNNSGGYFIQNEDVDHYVAIQALNAKHAMQRAEDILENYSESCECCGSRWYYWIDDSDGTTIPEIYGTPYTETKKSYYRENMIVHYIDGTKEKYVFAD